MIVSPWVSRLGTSHLDFDHTSILRTLAEKFAPGERRAFRIVETASGVDCVFRRPVSSVWPALDLTECRDDQPAIPLAPPLPAQIPAAPGLLAQAGQLAVHEITKLFGVLP